MEPTNIPNYQPESQPINSPIIFTEVWRPITKNSVPTIKMNAYLISTFGRVYSLLSEKLLPGEISCHGYIRVSGQTDRYDKRVKFSVHRVMMIEFCPVPGYQTLQVNHKDTIKLHNYIWNLEWATSSENSLYSYKDGCRVAPNTDNYQLSDKSYTSDTIYSIPEETIKWVEDLLSNGVDFLTIHRRTKCSMADIEKIKYKMNYGHYFDQSTVFQNRFSEFRLRFTDEQIHAICKYFQDHKDIKYKKISDMFRDCLYELFGVEFNESLHNAMGRYYKRIYRHDITDLYDY